jgi:DNA-binding SARP family transcriptional activator
MTDRAVARLFLLGGFDLVSADHRRIELCGSGQRLLAYLAVHARLRPVSRRPLAERLWDDLPPERAASMLRSVLWRLPRPAGRKLVDSTATSVRLASWVDVDLWSGEEQARRLHAGRSDAGTDVLDRPVAGLTSDLLPDWCEDWLTLEQESYRQARLHALEDLSAGLRMAGRYPAALEAGLAAVGSEPLRESAHRRVIEVFLAEGNWAQAVRQFRRFRRLLADELGLSPSPAITDLMTPLTGIRRSGGEPVSQVNESY